MEKIRILSDERVPDQITMMVEVCCLCSVRFAVTKAFQDLRRKDHARFYCPSGHGMSYNTPTKERDAVVDELEAENVLIRAELVAAKLELDAVRSKQKRPRFF